MKRDRWRAVLWIGFMTAMLCLGILFTMPERVSAAKKSKISWSVKNGTLTFRGKGEIPRQIKVADKKKITKIVVKKGITVIPAYAFRGFKNVKEVIIARSVKEIGDNALPDSKVLKKLRCPGHFIARLTRKEMLYVIVLFLMRTCGSIRYALIRSYHWKHYLM